MQKHNHIKALFFLGIFSLLLVHQIVPHLHHQHEIEHTHEAVSHSDSHSHHHDVPEIKDSKKDLFDLFLEAHIHSLVSNEILLLQNSSVKQFKVKKNVKTFISVNHYYISLNYDETEMVSVYQPPNIYFDSYLSSFDSRGPPALG